MKKNKTLFWIKRSWKFIHLFIKVEKLKVFGEMKAD